ncbi:hypothetical protein BT69DRAFT_93086 [Atractiella rhizophila]|nr:hypothetical protein BT69DRAFT_93086 [Atractiella rhizophila]
MFWSTENLIQLLVWCMGRYEQIALRLLIFHVQQYRELVEQDRISSRLKELFCQDIFIRDSQIAGRMRRAPLLKDEDIQWMMGGTRFQLETFTTSAFIQTLDPASFHHHILQCNHAALDRELLTLSSRLANSDSATAEGILEDMFSRWSRFDVWLELHYAQAGRKIGPENVPEGMWDGLRPLHTFAFQSRMLFEYFSDVDWAQSKFNSFPLIMRWSKTKKLVAQLIHSLAAKLRMHLDNAGPVGTPASNARVTACWTLTRLPGGTSYIARYLDDEDDGFSRTQKLEDIGWILESMRPTGFLNARYGEWSTVLEESLTRALTLAPESSLSERKNDREREIVPMHKKRKHHEGEGCETQ